MDHPSSLFWKPKLASQEQKSFGKNLSIFSSRKKTNRQTIFEENFSNAKRNNIRILQCEKNKQHFQREFLHCQKKRCQVGLLIKSLYITHVHNVLPACSMMRSM
jgi:hypothetical protein